MIQLRDLIGKPWAVPCDPPKTYDCWELVRTVRNRAQLMTPTYVDRYDRVPSDRRMMECPPQEWGRLLAPQPYCVVVMEGGRHVGVVVDGIRDVIHCDMFSGVRIDPVSILRRKDELKFWELRDA